MAVTKVKEWKEPKTAKQMLAALRRFLKPQQSRVDYMERQKLWNVLTALRGPDSDNMEEKSATTGIIRKKALGKSMPYGYSSNADSPTKLERRETLSGHFKSHALSAFEALGLKWDQVNEVK